MIKALLGQKVGMTQVPDDEGTLIPVTVLRLGPCPIVQVNEDDEGSCISVQIGFDQRKRKNTPKPLLGHFDKAGVEPTHLLREVEPQEGSEPQPGETVSVDIFQDIPLVDVTGTSKGRGFAGVIKRHGFSGGPKTHGSRFHRHAGSIGPGTDPGRVIKGRKMAGHMGDEKVTVKNLEIVRVDPERNLLLVKGGVPGSKKSYVVVRFAHSLESRQPQA